MSTPKDGGSAFPKTETCYSGAFGASPTIESRGGMTLRDYFAGKALVGILSNPQLTDTKAAIWVADYADEVADAMLAKRAKGQNERD